MNVPMIHTKEGITVILSGVPYSVAKEDKHFEDVRTAIEDGAYEEDILEIFERVKNKLANTEGLTYESGVVTINGEQLRGYVVDKLLAFLAAGYDVTPIKGFLTKLQDNPSKGVIDNLYQFLEHGKMPLTNEGKFVAYKAVREDYKDIHSGTMDNSLGETVSIARNKVDDRRDVTCSSGLHVCSFDYLPHFSHANGHVVLVEVNPKDVVAIPSDYNNTKMRVSEYTVIGEVENYYADKKDVLAGDEIWDEEYSVYLDGDFDEVFDSFIEARDSAILAVTDEAFTRAEVRDSSDLTLFTVGG